MIKNSYKTIVSFLFFLFTLFSSYFLGEIFYNSIDGTDFYRYFRYIEYFNGSIEATSREQGLMYFWYISNFIELSQNYYLPDKWEFIYSSAIQLGNFILYIFGLLGLYTWLKSKRVDNVSIFLSLSVLNFLPSVFGARLIMKPEMLIFCFMPWVLISLDNYFNYKNKTSLIFLTPLLSLLVTSKGTIAAILFFSIVYLYFEHIKTIKLKELIAPLSFFVIMTSLLYMENTNINSVSLLSHKELDQYLFRAPISFLYNINFTELFQDPFRNTHSNSLIGITLIDFFGDYFNRYWDHSRSLFIKNRTDILNFLPEPRRNISLIFSIVFLICSIFFKKNNIFKKYQKVYLVGTLLLALTSLGLFGLHFNPDKGDTVKSHYYFYLIAISFLVIFIQYLSDKKFFIQLISVFLIVSLFLFIFGFPKNIDDEFGNQLQNKLSATVGCKISSVFFDNISDRDTTCLNKKIATCGLYENYNKPKEHQDGYLIFQSDDFFNPLNLIDNSGYTVTVNGYAECLNYVDGGYFRNTNIYLEDRTPKFNSYVLFLALVSIAGLSVVNSRNFKSKL